MISGVVRVVDTSGGTHFAAPFLSITAYNLIIICAEVMGENESYESTLFVVVGWFLNVLVNY